MVIDVVAVAAVEACEDIPVKPEAEAAHSQQGQPDLSEDLTPELEAGGQVLRRLYSEEFTSWRYSASRCLAVASASSAILPASLASRRLASLGCPAP